MRQGASWTAAYHRQLTVAAWPGPSIAAWVPPASLRLRGPDCCSPRRRLPGGASSRYREVGRRRRGRPCQQARHGVGRRCPAGGVHPSGFGVRDPAVQPSGVRSPGVVQRVRRSAVCCPPVRCPAVRCPAVWCPAVWCPPPSVRTHPSGPPAGRGVWGQADAARQPAPWERGPGPLWAAPSSSGLGRRPSRPGPRRRRRGHAWSAGLSGADPGRVGCGRRPPLTLASGQARPACGAPVAGGGAVGHGRRRQREVAAPTRGCRPRMGGRPRCVVVVAPAAGVDGPGGPMGLPVGMGVRPQRGPGWATSVPVLLPTAL